MGHRRSRVSGADRSTTYTLKPTAGQAQRFSDLLTWQCRLYNAALEERRGAWRLEKREVTLYEQINELTGAAIWAPELAAYGRRVAEGTLMRLDDAFHAFFRRVTTGEKPGYPRFQPLSRFDSAQWFNRSWRLTRTGKGTYGRLYIQGIGHVSVKIHRFFDEAEPWRLVVRRRGQGRSARWEAISWRGVKIPQLAPTGRACGIDLGVTVLAAVVDDVGRVELVENPRPLKQHQRRLTAAKRALARCKKTGRYDGGRRNRAKAQVLRHHQKVRQVRREKAHQLSARLVLTFDLIALEDLVVATMTRSAKGTLAQPGTGVATKSGLNRSILDAGWGQLVRFITYKAESAGRCIERVKAPYTSQTCVQCGHTDAASRVNRNLFCCTTCGHVAHADANAAAVVLALATGQLVIEIPKRANSVRPGSGHRSATTGRDAA